MPAQGGISRDNPCTFHERGTHSANRNIITRTLIIHNG
jgi:hypothetical protein